MDDLLDDIPDKSGSSRPRKRDLLWHLMPLAVIAMGLGLVFRVERQNGELRQQNRELIRQNAELIRQTDLATTQRAAIAADVTEARVEHRSLEAKVDGLAEQVGFLRGDVGEIGKRVAGERR